MSGTVLRVEPIIQPEVRALCWRPYPGHPRGCPNIGRRETCPPTAPLFSDAFDLSQPVYAILTEFDLGAHVARMKEKHPNWSDAQLRCCLYWQSRARASQKAAVRAFLCDHPGYQVTTVPEAMGVNVTETLKAAGIQLEWPPVHLVRQVALAGVPRQDT
ncbi:MAG: hypothetical protein ACM3WU_06270 [Bacillota bacterium]